MTSAAASTHEIGLGEARAQHLAPADIERTHQHRRLQQQGQRLGQGEGERRDAEHDAAAPLDVVARRPERGAKGPRHERQKEDAADRRRLRRERESAQHDGEIRENVEKERHPLIRSR